MANMAVIPKLRTVKYFSSLINKRFFVLFEQNGIYSMMKLFLAGPIFLYLGIAGQNFGLFLSSILAPFWLFMSESDIKKRQLRMIGLYLLAAWGIWPLCNLIAAAFPGRASLLNPIQDLPGPLSITQHAFIMGKWTASQLPSSIAVSGFCLFVGSFFPFRRGRFSNNRNTMEIQARSPNLDQLHETSGIGTSEKETQPLIHGLKRALKGPLKRALIKNGIKTREDAVYSWLKILFFSSFIVGIYFAVQHLTGFDFRPSQSHLPNMRFPGDTYRIQGFSGHPLTIAGISLGLIGYSTWLIKDFIKTSPKTAMYLAGVMLLNLFFLYASGGRTAFLIGATWLGLFGSYVASRYVSRRVLIIGILAGLVFFFVTLMVSDLGARYFEAVPSPKSGTMPNRIIFWRVHWQMFLDSPWFGQGFGNLSKGLRFMYYDALGYRSLDEQFNAHNMILETLSNIGVLGTLALIWLGFKIFQIARNLSQSSFLSKNLGMALIVAWALNFLHGMTQNVFYDSGVMVVYVNLFLLFIWSSMGAKEVH